MLLLSVYTRQFLRSLALRQIFNPRVFLVSGFSQMWLPSSYLFEDSPADDTIHGVFLKAKRSLLELVADRLSPCALLPSPESRVQMEKLGHSGGLLQVGASKEFHLERTHRHHFPIYDLSFDCCLLAKPFLDMDQ